jgi:hypothetical protein
VLDFAGVDSAGPDLPAQGGPAQELGAALPPPRGGDPLHFELNLLSSASAVGLGFRLV